MNQYSDTTKVVLWFSNLWNQLKYNQSGREQIQERIQEYIVNPHFLEKQELAELGELIWIDFNCFETINSMSAFPEIQEQNVLWNQVGETVAEKVLINFWDLKDDKEEN
jgi:hypothetical protein